jgi:hypothetical protein
MGNLDSNGVIHVDLYRIELKGGKNGKKLYIEYSQCSE